MIKKVASALVFIARIVAKAVERGNRAEVLASWNLSKNKVHEYGSSSGQHTFR
jgi:hypothetical protein